MKDLKTRLENLSDRQRLLLSRQLNQQKTNTDDDRNSYKPKRIIAYFVSNNTLDKQDLRLYMKERVPEYMVPATFIQLDELPHLPNGKIDLNALQAVQVLEENNEAGFAAANTEVEQKLVEIWEEVLGFNPISIHDNFFEIGGDSILSIQIIAKARKHGLILTSDQLYEYQTIAQLALFVKKEASESENIQSLTGNFSLTPIQSWFFDEHQKAPHHWNQAVIFEIDDRLNSEKAEQAANTLIQHHDALRLSFSNDKGIWQAMVKTAEEIDVFRKVSLEAISREEQSVRIEATVKLAQSGLKLKEGGLFQVVYFDCGQKQANRLLMLSHHLLVDNVSWNILKEDFSGICQNLLNHENTALSAKTASFQSWSLKLNELAHSGYYDKELDFWLEQSEDKEKLPLDFDSPIPVPEESVEFIGFEFDETLNGQLLAKINDAYNTRTDELLIAALMHAFGNWAGIDQLCVGLERHGRETTVTDQDISSTVGWFTCYFPLKLDFKRFEDSATLIPAIKEQLRKLPNGGLGYGILRYLSDSEDYREKLNQRPKVIFNFLGSKQSVKQNRILNKEKWVQEGSRDPKSERYHMLELNSMITEGRLEFQLGYSKLLFSEETVKRLIKYINEALVKLTEHCINAGGGYTPSDFPEAELNQKDLDQLLGQLDL